MYVLIQAVYNHISPNEGKFFVSAVQISRRAIITYTVQNLTLSGYFVSLQFRENILLCHLPNQNIPLKRLSKNIITRRHKSRLISCWQVYSSTSIYTCSFLPRIIINFFSLGILTSDSTLVTRTRPWRVILWKLCEYLSFVKNSTRPPFSPIYRWRLCDANCTFAVSPLKGSKTSRISGELFN